MANNELLRCYFFGIGKKVSKNKRIEKDDHVIIIITILNYCFEFS